jgi:hypothetical protein
MNTDPKQDEPRQTTKLLTGYGPDAMKIVKALGLPELTRCFSFSMAAHEAAIVTVELQKYVEGDADTVDALASVFEHYRLVKIEDEPVDALSSVFERYHLVKIEDETGDDGGWEGIP